MERIKQAIENAENPGAIASVHSRYSKAEHAHYTARWEIIKNISAVILIIFGGWLWMRLDFMNRLELVASEYIHDGVKQARAEAGKRLEDEAKFRQLIENNLAYCQEAAERDKENYMSLVLKEVRIKDKKSSEGEQVKFYMPNAALSEAESMLVAAMVDCRQVYETHLKNGR